MFIVYATELAISIYREIKENSSKTTINTKFGLKMLILKFTFLESSCHPDSVRYVKAHNLIDF